jgi:hypothetical protein
VVDVWGSAGGTLQSSGLRCDARSTVLKGSGPSLIPILLWWGKRFERYQWEPKSKYTLRTKDRSLSGLWSKLWSEFQLEIDFQIPLELVLQKF